MARSALKRRRLMAGMTQTQVADAMGVSQPNYQRWEAGTASVPAAKLRKLARVLETSVDEILGKPLAFDLFGTDENAGDARKYFGEVAIHFGTRGSLLLPISEEVCSSLHRQLQGRSSFIIAESLDNRKVFIRRAAIKDVYFSSEAYDTYGPEVYEDHLGVLPDDDFWRIVEHMDFLDCLEEEFEESKINEVLNKIVMTDEDLERLVVSGKVAPEDREKVKEKAAAETQKFLDRATSIIWQLSSGQLRCEYLNESKLLYDTFSLIEIDPDDVDELIYLPVEGYHRSIFIRKSEIDYVSIPAHKFNEGSLESAEEELGNS
ncbi:helix-turn-helix domain-containing protein [Methylocaldum sp. GT1BB]|jgi:transcriptional regulator with XRE-family HTH domain|uniref:helix-turn-helix domain-containing protein n=1 Tax=Methylocaldum sp. GT1BB TaxID=3438963 RepID=UPI003DA06CEA